MQAFSQESCTPAKAQDAVVLVRRSEIPTQRRVEIDGIDHNLGILKDFRKHPAMAAFLPERARLSLAWVRLEPGEELAVHQHPTESMIVLAVGQGIVMGDYHGEMEGGDVILIPRGALHGFRGAGPTGFWALSIQFEGHGLYEDMTQARVTFAVDEASPGFRTLMEQNRCFADLHLQNKLFQLVTSGVLQQNNVYNRFFATVLVWSGYFQRAILARSATTDDASFAPIFRAHLAEEFGHDTNLAHDLGKTRSARFDPVLDAAGTWFCSKMLTADNLEKLVLIHLILEVGSSLFSAHAAAYGVGSKRTDYFHLHDEADDGHARIGLDLLKNLHPDSYLRLFQVQKEGWSMLELLSARIAELSLQEVVS